MSAAQINQLDEAHSWHIVRIAERFGLHRDTVRARLRAAGVQPVGERNGKPVYSLKDIGPALFDESHKYTADNDPDKMRPTDRRAWYESEQTRIAIAERLRHLIPDEEVGQGYSLLIKGVVAGLDSLPDILERDAGLSPEALQIVQRIVDEVREHIYRWIVDDNE